MVLQAGTRPVLSPCPCPCPCVRPRQTARPVSSRARPHPARAPLCPPPALRSAPGASLRPSARKRQPEQLGPSPSSQLIGPLLTGLGGKSHPPPPWGRDKKSQSPFFPQVRVSVGPRLTGLQSSARVTQTEAIRERAAGPVWPSLHEPGASLGSSWALAVQTFHAHCSPWSFSQHFKPTGKALNHILFC